jgi:hypothetical protein
MDPKFQLIISLFELNIWEEGVKLYKILIDSTSLEPFWNPEISKKICEKISEKIEKVYSKISPKIMREEELKAFKFEDQDVQFLKTEIFPLLGLLDFDSIFLQNW